MVCVPHFQRNFTSTCYTIANPLTNSWSVLDSMFYLLEGNLYELNCIINRMRYSLVSISIEAVKALGLPQQKNHFQL